jgi:hypothetical protein
MKTFSIWRLVVSIHEFFSHDMLLNLASANRRDVLINKYAIAIIAKNIGADPDRLFARATQLAQEEVSGELTSLRIEQEMHPTQEDS